MAFNQHSIFFCFICPILSTVSFSFHSRSAWGPSKHSLHSSSWPGQGGWVPWPAHSWGGHSSCGNICHWVRRGGLWWRGSFLSDEPSACLTYAVRASLPSHAAPRKVFHTWENLTPSAQRLQDWLEAENALQSHWLLGQPPNITLVWKVSSWDWSHLGIKAVCPFAGSLGL